MKKRSSIILGITTLAISMSIVGCNKEVSAQKTETKVASSSAASKDDSNKDSKTSDVSNITSTSQKDKYLSETKKVYDEKTAQDSKSFEPYYVKGVLLVNKRHPLPSTYAKGEDKEAKAAFEKMAAAAKKEGVVFTAFSTYRSYAYQTTLYNKYVNKSGKEEADRYSARPGFSEHQSGLGFDIGGPDKTKWADQSFKGSKEANWLNANATKYGFILRFPEGKEWLTGYMYEPWHFRYVGTEISKKFEGKEGYTLEEYLGAN